MQPWKRLSWIVALEVGTLLVVATRFLPGGEDLYRYYRPMAEGCLQCGFTPYYAQWVLWPLRFIPLSWTWTVWTLITVALLLALCWRTEVNPAIVLLAFPTMGQVWLGQIDALIAVGLGLAQFARYPWLRGVGIWLALIKPQVSAPAVVVLLLRHPPRERRQMMLVPLGAFLLSLIVYGPDWPWQWLVHSSRELPRHAWRLAAETLWPYGLTLLVALLLLMPRRLRVLSTLLLTAIATPFFSIYTYIVFLVFYAPWWSLPVSYLWALLYPFFGLESMRYAGLLPIALLIDLWRQGVFFTPDT